MPAITPFWVGCAGTVHATLGAMNAGSFFLDGLAIGFSIAAPVGPIGILCIRRSLADGPLGGLASGLGAATADAAYGCVAAFGLTAVSGFLSRQQVALGLVGGAFLCYLGIRTMVRTPPPGRAAPGGAGPLGAYASTLLLTLANPATILSFAAVFAGLGLGGAADFGSAAKMVAGVFLGSAAWWVILSSCVGLLRSRVNDTWMKAINLLSGAVLVAFGLYAFSRI
jgi:threonine/homoserine/homoserine lactone efflux protein